MILFQMLYGYQILLMLLAVVPGIYLMFRVYRLDPVEKEPIGLILKLLLAGAVTTYAAMIIEFAGMYVLGAVLPEDGLLYTILENFVVVACAEEGVKYCALKNLTWGHPAFDHRFDAIVYAVAVGLGFAMLENVNYVFQYGVVTAVVRAVTAVPAHTIFAVFMGHFYGGMKLCDARGDEAGRKGYQLMALLIPILMHGTYDLFASDESAVALIIFVILVVITDLVSLRKIKQYAQEDARL